MKDWLFLGTLALIFVMAAAMLVSTYWHQRKVAEAMAGPVTAFYIYSQGHWVEFVPKKGQK